MPGFELGREAVEQIQEVVRAYMNRTTVVRPDRGRFASGSGGCKGQNCKLQVTILGAPTGGTLDLILTINAVTETLSIAYNASASAVKTELETHAQIKAGDVAVSNGPFPNSTMDVEFKGDLAKTDISIPSAVWSSLSGGSGVAVITSKTQIGYPKSG